MSPPRHGVDGWTLEAYSREESITYNEGVRRVVEFARFLYERRNPFERCTVTRRIREYRRATVIGAGT